MKIAAVFVHGFTGGTETWLNDNSLSLKDMLAADPALATSYDFFEFEYFTKISDLGHSAIVQNLLSLWGYVQGLPKRTGRIKKNQPIARLSEQLTGYLRFNLSEYSQVLLITHSLGGLIGKQYILAHEPGAGPLPVGYVSMAVPHKGSLHALLLGPTCNINVQELTPLSEYGDRLNSEWGDKREKLPPALYMIAQHDEFVSNVSAVPFSVANKQKVVVDHDHRSICKPATITDTAFLAVKTFMSQVAYTKSMADAVTSAVSSTTPDYDKEIFVLKMMVCEIGPQGIDDAKDCFFNAELVSKAANKEDAAEMNLLKKKVLSLYKQKYNSFYGTAHTSNHVFSSIHQEIVGQDNNALKSSVAYLNFLHKKGLLHQLANDLGKTVVWSDDPEYLDKVSKILP